MSRRLTVFSILAAILLALILLGRHLDVEYRSLVASTQKAPALYEAKIIDDMSAQIIADLTDRDVEVAIISRAGQPRKRLPSGIAYTHSAFWLRTENGEYEVYNLYHGEDDRTISSLIADRPIDFIGPTRAQDFGVIVPSRDFQNALKSHILSRQYGQAHQSNYSMISNPFDIRYQNCNEFLLDEMASFHWQETDANQLKEKLSQAIQPTEIKAGIIRRYIAPLVDERFVIKDHGKQILTVTRPDLIEFLEDQNLLLEAYILDFTPAASL